MIQKIHIFFAISDCFHYLVTVGGIRFGSPEIKLYAFCCIPNFGVFENMHFWHIFTSSFQEKYFVIHKFPDLQYHFLKVYLKKMYTIYKHYVKMRKILTCAKLLLSSI